MSQYVSELCFKYRCYGKNRIDRYEDGSITTSLKFLLINVEDTQFTQDKWFIPKLQLEKKRVLWVENVVSVTTQLSMIMIRK